MKRSQIKRGPGPKRKTRLRSRSFTERFKDDPIRYGVLFRIIRKLPCFVSIQDYSHQCAGPGRHTAHHEGEDDLAGLLPCCGYVHRGLEGSVNRTRSEYLIVIGMTEEDVAELAMRYVRDCLISLGIDPDLSRDEIIPLVAASEDWP